VPALLVAFSEVARGGEDLAEVGPAIGGGTGGAQRLERERLAVEQDRRDRLLIASCDFIGLRVSRVRLTSMSAWLLRHASVK
jgi:hypothetical protein